MVGLVGHVGCKLCIYALGSTTVKHAACIAIMLPGHGVLLARALDSRCLYAIPKCFRWRDLIATVAIDQHTSQHDAPQDLK
jgi:hypothetical protein